VPQGPELQETRKETLEGGLYQAAYRTKSYFERYLAIAGAIGAFSGFLRILRINQSLYFNFMR